MSRRKIKRNKSTHVMPETIIEQDITETSKEEDSKTKRAFKITKNFFKGAGLGIGSSVKTSVTKGIIPASCATGKFFKNTAIKTKDSIQGFTQARKALSETKRIDQEATVLANLMTVKLDKVEAIEALQDLQQKMQDNLSSIEAAILILQEEVENE